MKKQIRILVLTTDAFGGYGGIALYNRDFLSALASYSTISEIVAVPRLMPNPPEPFPQKLTYVTAAVKDKEYVAEAIGGKLKYINTIWKLLRENPRFDLIVCGHINLLPIAYLAKFWTSSPLLLLIYGIDAWQPAKSKLTNYLVGKIKYVASASEVTLKRFLEWSRPLEAKTYILHNAIHTELFRLGDKSPELLSRYRLNGKNILMTFGRLVSAERAKGFDEVLELLPDMLAKRPDLAYLIVGGGADRQRLEQRAKDLGVFDHVVFAGMISEDEKADHFRLADVYVMPSRGEGFGFVFLEAMACGIPVIASDCDGGREAVRFGMIGQVVNPDDRTALMGAIEKALDAKKGIPDGLEYFSFANFQSRLKAIVTSVTSQV